MGFLDVLTPSEERTDLASVAQKRRLRTDITINSLDTDVMDGLFRGVGFARIEGEKVNDAINRLTPEQCSTLIDTIGQGAVRTGASDVPPPAADDFRHPPVSGSEFDKAESLRIDAEAA